MINDPKPQYLASTGQIWPNLSTALQIKIETENNPMTKIQIPWVHPDILKMNK